MKFDLLQKQTSRLEILRGSAMLASSALLAHFFPATLLRASATGHRQQTSSPADLLRSMRAKFNAAPLKAERLSEDVTMLSGPGASVGLDGKFVVDTFVAPAWPRLKQALYGLGNAPLRAAGATVLAHENAKKRMAEPHDLPVLYRGPDGALFSLHFDPSPAEALPQQTFQTTYKLQANGESLALQHVGPARTDTDIYVHFEKANVIQMGDLFFNWMYPYIDSGKGGKITGMIAAADRILSLADQEAVAEKPFADLDPVWGNGIINSEQWVQIVYLTL